MAFSAAQTLVETLIGTVPELQSVAVVFHWNVPVSAEVPPAVALTRAPGGDTVEDVRHPAGLHGLLTQTTRLSSGLTNRLHEALAGADRLAHNLAQQINERRHELGLLDAAIAAATPRAPDPLREPVPEFRPRGGPGFDSTSRLLRDDPRPSDPPAAPGGAGPDGPAG